MMESDVVQLVDAYVAQWNERDPVARREIIGRLWAPEAVHYTKSLEACGRAAIEDRVRTAHDRWVRDAGYRFESMGNAESHHNGIRFNWTMRDGEKIEATGFDFLLLDGAGRIMMDFQFNGR